jgi:hypothetical protein
MATCIINTREDQVPDLSGRTPENVRSYPSQFLLRPGRIRRDCVVGLLGPLTIIGPLDVMPGCILLANGAPSDNAVIWPVVLIVELVAEPGPPRLGFRGESVEFGFVTLFIEPCPLSLRDVVAFLRRA